MAITQECPRLNLVRIMPADNGQDPTEPAEVFHPYGRVLVSSTTELRDAGFRGVSVQTAGRNYFYPVGEFWSARVDLNTEIITLRFPGNNHSALYTERTYSMTRSSISFRREGEPNFPNPL